MRMIKLQDLRSCLIRRKLLLCIVLACSLLAGVVVGRMAVQFHQNKTNNQHNSAINATAYNNSLSLEIAGSDGYVAYRLEFQNHFRTAHVQITNRTLPSATTVRILDVDGGAQDAHEAGAGQALAGAPADYNLALRPGCVIELRASTATFYSTLDRSVATAFQPSAAIERYVVMDGGLRKIAWGEADGRNALHEILQNYLTRKIAQYQAQISDVNLHNRKIDTAMKAQAQADYRLLDEQRRAPYRNFIEQLAKGGTPTLNWTGMTTYQVGDHVNLSRLVYAYDNEDGGLPNSAIKAETNLDTNEAGVYMVKFTVQDSDRNVATLTRQITVTDPHRPQAQPAVATSKPQTVTLTEAAQATDTHQATDATAATHGSDSLSAGKNDDTQAGPVDQAESDRKTERQTEAKPKGDQASQSGVTISEASQVAAPESAEKSRKTELPSLIAAILASILAVAGFVRFIFDHYIR